MMDSVAKTVWHIMVQILHTKIRSVSVVSRIYLKISQDKELPFVVTEGL
jgi:hypothetical protein